jgi:tRNA1Val (adenine37-N6)-methyltransferase
MANPCFAFKQFTIYHDKCAMKVGTDGVLLGAWVNVQSAERILDVGTGSGLIAIMLAQRSDAVIDAVEIDERAYSQAFENIAACPWSVRINIHQDSFQHFAGITEVYYDVVVSNPPYFRNSLKSSLISRSLARHDQKLSHESLLFYSSQILAPEGRLALIIPADDITHLMELAYFHKLYPSQLLMIRPDPDKNYSRCLAEFTHNRDQDCIENELIIKQKDSVGYTENYKSLTRDFYLNF